MTGTVVISRCGPTENLCVHYAATHWAGCCGPNKFARQWLRTFLGNCKDTAEKKELTTLLASRP